MKLEEWKRWKGYSLAKCAEVLGISESYLSLILAGKRRTSPEMALQIENKTEGRIRREELVWPETEDANI